MQILNNHIISFLNNFFNKETNILHFGSSLQSNLFNDIDLMILSDEYTDFTKEIIQYKSLSFDITIVPKQKIYQIIELNKINGIYVSIFEKGRIIKDTDGTIDIIKNHINENKIQPSLFLKKQYTEYLLKEAILNLKSAIAFEADLLFYNLLVLLIDYKLIDFNIGNAIKVKNKYKEISKFDPNYLITLTKIKEKFTKNRSHKELSVNLNSIMPLQQVISKKYYSNRYKLSNIYNTNLVIQINGVKSINDFLDLTKDISSFLDVDLYFFNVEKSSSLILEDAYYIVLVDSNERLKVKAHKLKELINKNIIEDLRFIYPYQIEMSSFLGQFDSTEFKNIEKGFISLSKFILSNYSKKSNTLLWYINLLIGSNLYLGKNKDQFSNDISNLGRLYGHDFLNNSKEHKKALYYKLGFSNEVLNYESDIKDIYKDVINNWAIQYLPDSMVNKLIKNIAIENSQDKIHLINFLARILFLKEEYLIYFFHIAGEILQDLDEY